MIEASPEPSSGVPVATPGRRVPALDGLRGLAALLVVFQHVQPDGRWPTGILGVDIFFALSGLLIGGILLDSRGRPDFFRRFFLRRTLRIWPLYEVVVLIVVATDAVVPVRSNEPPWMLVLFLGNWAVVGLATTRTAAGVLWSLAVEEHFYLLLPPLIAFTRPRRVIVGLLTLVVGASASRYLVGQHWGFMAAYVLTPCRIDALCWGVIAAWILRFRPSWVGVISVVAPWLCVLRLAMLPDNPASRTDALSVLLLQPLSSIVTAALLVGLVSGRTRRCAKALAVAPLAWVGTISYGLYLLHPLVIEATDAVLRQVLHAPPTFAGRGVALRFAMVTAITSIVAWCSWRWFEAPILRMSERPRHGAATGVVAAVE